jgi:hypothetical protein
MDLYTTGVLNRIVQQIDVAPAAFFLNRYFMAEQTEDSEEIHFDVSNEEPRLAPFVSPIRAGRIVEDEGYTTSTFKPAYVKDKRVFDSERPVKRVIGEPILGSLSPAERTRRLLAQSMANQMRMLDRREELMASEYFQTGKITVTGEGFEDKVVDFGRDASLTVADLTGTDRWTDTGSNPLGDLETWAGLIYDAGGGVATDVIMANDVWTAFRSHASVATVLDTRRGSTSRGETGPLAANRVKNPATIGEFEIYVYSDKYIDDTGTAGNMVPSGSVIMVNGMGLEGVRHYGMIKDYKNNHGAQRAFVKSWEEEDPSRRFLLLQSAPLVVPYRPNSSLFCDVLNGGA